MNEHGFAQLSRRTRMQLEQAMAAVNDRTITTNQVRELISVEMLPERDRRILARWGLYELFDTMS